MMIRQKKAAQFTLVEMLVVISIIAILASMLLPAMQNAIGIARDSSCAGQQRQLGVAAHSYANDYYDLLPINWYEMDNLYAGLSSNDPIRPAGSNGLGKLFELSYVADGLILACGNEDEPKKQKASLGYGGALRFSLGQRNSNNINSTDYWYRCGRRRNIGNISQISLKLTKVPNEGLIMCAAKSQYSYVINWYELHQRRGFNLIFTDLHVEFYSYAAHLTPDLWGSNAYRADNPATTFNSALKNLRE